MNISWSFFGKPPKSSLNELVRDLRHDLFYGAISDWGASEIRVLGNTSNGCSWAISEEALDEKSIVVSAGAGRDISFELEIIDKVGCKVIILDPSTTGIETMSKAENQHSKIEFLPKALSSSDNPIYLARPLDEAEGSWRPCRKTEAIVTVPAISLSSLMRQMGVSKIDLLKMDIEGSEYPVVDSIVAENIQIEQICVEYHNQVLPGYSRSQTIKSLLQLWKKGYRIIHKDGSNHSLRRKYGSK